MKVSEQVLELICPCSRFSIRFCKCLDCTLYRIGIATEEQQEADQVAEQEKLDAEARSIRSQRRRERTTRVLTGLIWILGAVLVMVEVVYRIT